MRKAFLFTLLTLAIAASALAEDDRHQSYLSYDDGGTVIRSSDGREIDAHRNLPVYPGDEVITARRGRAEVRLSDGNIIGIDRTTALRFRSILDSYEGEADETVAELQYGKVAVHRTDIGRDHVRLDTNNASYVADYEAIYSVETDSQGRDRVTVFEGTIEVRTPNRSTRVRAGETINVDEGGVYDLAHGQDYAADDFERWFMQRADRFDNYSSKYVDRNLGYWADDLDDNGRWVFATGIGWSWRPFVAVGWRPYRNGYWHYSRYGCLTWVSYDPWGWGPYHYGRWAYDPGFGWLWVPGYGYSPAWVYWMYGPGYVGWAPAGWWDAYRPYYHWAYDPYRNYGVGRHNFGFYGRVRVSELDLRPWTFVDSGTLVSRRIDRAALTTDAVKDRLARSRDGFATMAGGASRFTREELRDPAEAIRRRGLDGRGTGRETGAPATDLTPFARRDTNLSGSIRERLGRGAGAAPAPVAGGTVSGPTRSAGGGISRRGSGGLAPIGGGSVAPITGGSVAPIQGSDRRAGSGAAVSRPPVDTQPADDRRRTIGGRDREPGSGTPDRREGGIGRDRGDNSQGTRDRSTGSWRGGDRRGDQPQAAPPTTTAPDTSTQRPPRENSWRGRVRSEQSSYGPSPRGAEASSRSDVPRRVIDRIGGARVIPRESGSAGRERVTSRSTVSGRERSTSRGSGSGSRESVRSGGSSDSRSSGSSGSSGSSVRSGSSSDRSGGSSTRSSGSSGSSRSSGGNRGSGGRIKRD